MGPTSSLATRGCVTSPTVPLIQLAGLHSCWAKIRNDHSYITPSNRRRLGSFFLWSLMHKVTHEIVYLPMVQCLEYSQQENMESGGRHCFILFFFFSSAALQWGWTTVTAGSTGVVVISYLPQNERAHCVSQYRGETSVSQWEIWSSLENWR